jgi:threonine aldolase
MDANAVYNLKKKVIKDFNTLKKYLGNGYKKDYTLIMQEICVIENADYFDNSVYEYLMTNIYE